MNYLDTVILYCLKQIDGERSMYSIFHILNGKKSSQTIQDAHLFHLSHLFQSFHYLTRDEFEQRIGCLKAGQWVQETVQYHYQLSDLGNLTIRKQLEQKPLPSFLNGLSCHALTWTFWERLSLLIQVCSNLVHHQSVYLPIQQKSDTQNWLKGF